jgi:hypothetical protein
MKTITYLQNNTNQIHIITMKTRQFLSIFIIITLISGAFFSCKKDEIKKPEISNFELGKNNSKQVHQGDELHIDATITAEGKIKTIRLIIHHEDEHGHKSITGEEWEVDKTYTSFEGLKNTKFHEHIDVPLTAEIGDYHLHFKVIDMEGNVAEIETEFEVLEKE